ncbi:MAG: hypothetical protein ACKO9Z_10395 [Planctomycetota bacterium]|nr:hypothetical protein [Planctomycetota bacterium]
MSNSSRTLALLLGGMAFWLAGCSESKVNITGTIMKGGKPLVVSKETYVTLQFLPESVASEAQSNSYSASFDQSTGKFRLELSPGKYKTNFIMALPAKDGQMSRPLPPVKSATPYDLTKSQELTIEVP